MYTKYHMYAGYISELTQMKFQARISSGKQIQGGVEADLLFLTLLYYHKKFFLSSV